MICLSYSQTLHCFIFRLLFRSFTAVYILLEFSVLKSSYSLSLNIPLLREVSLFQGEQASFKTVANSPDIDHKGVLEERPQRSNIAESTAVNFPKINANKKVLCSVVSYQYIAFTCRYLHDVMNIQCRMFMNG